MEVGWTFWTFISQSRRSLRSQRMSQLRGGLNGSTQHFTLEARMESWYGLSSSDLFYGETEGGDLGSLAARGVDELDRSAV